MLSPALEFKLDAEGQITDEPVELLAADAREEGDGKSLALAKTVAGFLGVSSDALALAGLAVWAEINRREAVAQREEAERNFEIAKQERELSGLRHRPGAARSGGDARRDRAQDPRHR